MMNNVNMIKYFSLLPDTIGNKCCLGLTWKSKEFSKKKKKKKLCRKRRGGKYLACQQTSEVLHIPISHCTKHRL